MRIWLVTIGEPLPLDGAGDRLLRAGLLAEQLTQSGHHVVWWTSTFNHARKQQRADRDTIVDLNDHYRIRMLHGRAYRSHVSINRLLNHLDLAERFRRQVSTEPKPDVILCSWPTVELCLEATRYGRDQHVPVVLDIRDLWPDLFLDLVPRIVRPAAKAVLRPLFRSAQVAARNATAITGITPEYIEFGLRHAGRQKESRDREFPMGYRQREPSAAEQAQAAAFWKQRGLARDSSEFIACWFGAMGRHSELATVIEAARLLQQRDAQSDSSGRPVRFVLCGAGPDLNRCRRLVRDCSNVLLPGWINAAQIWTLMRSASVGLTPYVSNDNYIRNVPNKPVEYLSAGLPIVSSLQGVLADLLAERQCGITYSNCDAAGLAAAIAGLRDDADRLHQMSENAQRLYRERFIAEKVYADMQNYLEQIAGYTGSARAA